MCVCVCAHACVCVCARVCVCFALLCFVLLKEFHQLPSTKAQYHCYDCASSVVVVER